MPDVTLYSRPNCQPCRATARKLTELGIEFDHVDVSEDEDAAALIKELGYKATPVIVAGEQHWHGYSPDRIKGLVDAPDA